MDTPVETTATICSIKTSGTGTLICFDRRFKTINLLNFKSQSSPIFWPVLQTTHGKLHYHSLTI